MNIVHVILVIPNGAPPFVGDDYFVLVLQKVITGEHFLHIQDDQNFIIPCYGLNDRPWFNKTLPAPTSDAIDFRLCVNSSANYANIVLKLLELYVHQQKVLECKPN